MKNLATMNKSYLWATNTNFKELNSEFNINETIGLGVWNNQTPNIIKAMFLGKYEYNFVDVRIDYKDRTLRRVAFISYKKAIENLKSIFNLLDKNSLAYLKKEKLFNFLKDNKRQYIVYDNSKLLECEAENVEIFTNSEAKENDKLAQLIIQEYEKKPFEIWGVGIRGFLNYKFEYAYKEEDYLSKIFESFNSIYAYNLINEIKPHLDKSINLAKTKIEKIKYYYAQIQIYHLEAKEDEAIALINYLEDTYFDENDEDILMIFYYILEIKINILSSLGQIDAQIEAYRKYSMKFGKYSNPFWKKFANYCVEYI